jgi:hypothetical protein
VKAHSASSIGTVSSIRRNMTPAEPVRQPGIPTAHAPSTHAGSADNSRQAARVCTAGAYLCPHVRCEWTRERVGRMTGWFSARGQGPHTQARGSWRSSGWPRIQSGRPDSNRRRPAWEAGILPLNYARGLCCTTTYPAGLAVYARGAIGGARIRAGCLRLRRQSWCQNQHSPRLPTALPT